MFTKRKCFRSKFKSRAFLSVRQTKKKNVVTFFSIATGLHHELIINSKHSVKRDIKTGCLFKSRIFYL